MLLSTHFSFLVPGPVKDSSLEFLNGNYSGLGQFLGDTMMVELFYSTCQGTRKAEAASKTLGPGPSMTLLLPVILCSKAA